MRESIGGAVMLKVVMLFIIIINSYLALSVNYSKAFKVKNRIISLIEQYESYDLAEKKIYEYLNETNYKVYDASCPSGYVSDPLGYGFCYARIQDTTKGYYYKVVTYINIELAILNMIFQEPFKITGETKMIYRGESL